VPTWPWVGEQEGGSAVEMGDPNIEWKPAASLVAAWQVLIETALNLKRVQFATYPVLNGQGKLIHYEAPARMQIIQSSLWMSAQEFMPWASRLGLTERIDEAVFDYALAWLETNEGPVCINVSPQSVCDPVLTTRYYRRSSAVRTLRRGSGSISRVCRLSPRPRIPRFLRHPQGAGLQNRSGACRQSDLPHRRTVRRRARLSEDRQRIIRDIDQNLGNQTFLRGLCTIAHTMGMMTVAEGVLNQREAGCLKELGFKGMTGPGIVLG